MSDRARIEAFLEMMSAERGAAANTLDAYARSRIPLEALPEKVAWRDESILALRALKAERGSVDRT